jgi:membrane protein required for colicin V production
MVLDVIGLILVFLFFIRGYLRGLIVAVFSVLAILFGILCALKFSQALSGWMLEKGYVTSGWVQIISYVLLFIGVFLLVRLLARMVQKAAEGMMLGVINKIIGGLLYAFLGAVLWSSLLWIGARMHMLPQDTVLASKTYNFFYQLAPWFFDQAGKLLPFVRDTFTKLEHFFDTVNSKPANVGAH